MTGWHFGTSDSVEIDGSSANIGKYEAQYLTTFNLDLTFREHCVGKAIESVGGPAGVKC